jgi:toxin YoeB
MNEPWTILYTKQGLKDKRTACASGFSARIKEILGILRNDPFTEYPPFEKLVGDLSGAYSRRVNRQHRVVYQVYPEKRIIKIISMWLHY